jgi:hypothetical protein
VRLFGAPKNKLRYSAAVAEFAEVGFVDGGEDGDGEQLERAGAPALDRRLDDAGAGVVDGEEFDASAGYLRDGSLDGGFDVEELVVEEDALALRGELAEKAVDVGIETEADTDFEEGRDAVEGFNDGSSLVDAMDIEGYDEAV